MDKIKFAELVAKTGIHFGGADGFYDDKEKAFVNLFIGFLKVNANVDADTQEIIRKASGQRCSVTELVNETRAIMADLPEEERKKTLESFANFIDTVVSVDGQKSTEEVRDFAIWKTMLL